MSTLITVPDLRIYTDQTGKKIYNENYKLQKIQWLKTIGDQVHKGDVICEIESKETMMELESFNSGIVLYINTHYSIKIGDILMILGSPEEEYQKTIDEYNQELSNNPEYQNLQPFGIQNKIYEPITKKNSNHFWKKIKQIFNL